MIGCRLTLLSYGGMLQFGEPSGVEVREYVVPLLAFLKEAPLAGGEAAFLSVILKAVRELVESLRML